MWLEGGSPQNASADHLVCAIPFLVLRRMDIAPNFSPEKQLAIMHLGYTSVARVYLQTRTRFWLKQGLSGYAATDLPLASLFETIPSQPGTRGILESYRTAGLAHRIAAMKESDRIRSTLEEAAVVFPEIIKQFEGGVSKC